MLECSWKLWVFQNFVIICYDLPKSRREGKAGIPFVCTKAFLYPDIEANIEQMEEGSLGKYQRHQIGKTMSYKQKDNNFWFLYCSLYYSQHGQDKNCTWFYDVPERVTKEVIIFILQFSEIALANQLSMIWPKSSNS